MNDTTIETTPEVQLTPEQIAALQALSAGEAAHSETPEVFITEDTADHTVN